ncbi:MAG TPA: hypothetical protein VNY05_22255 [Candidatus Acidoferrales bacterium]|jgi:hypothetical protein|nr:hypothetical protein [Candidatus Acidoferrales bacterium]
MSLCEYCDQKTGWFQSTHPACVAKAGSTGQVVRQLVIDKVWAGGSLADITSGVAKLSSDNRVKEQYVREAILDGLSFVAGEMAKKSPVSDDEYRRIEPILSGYQYKADPSKKRFGTLELSLSNMLWQASNNILPLWGDAPAFNLRAGEVLCFQAGGVIYAEEKTVSTGRGYGGLSVPVGLGMYAHVGQSQAQKVTGLMPLDGGQLAITSENVYFSGQNTTLQIPLRRVIRYQGYVDAIGICESHGAPKVFTFYQNCEFPDGRYMRNATGYDLGWFLYPFLTALTTRLIP